MNLQEKVYFDALSKDRAGIADVLDKRAVRGVRKSVSEKYSDQAHFIYELLQNANDANATSVRFMLFKDRLIFAHNGTRLFSVSNPETEEDDSKNGTLGDLNAITSYANSNKDGASIGKFGVGFKSVFQYTSTPHIYDPNIFFRLDREIVPSEVTSDYPNRLKDETLFEFPFDHAELDAAEAYEDISDKLRFLDHPLLFLANLKRISFEMPETLTKGLYGKSISRTQTIDDTLVKFVYLTQKNGDDYYDDRLWLFSRKTENDHLYSVGFFVDKNENLIAVQHTAFCFFPTKEVTKLNFIIHAPFLLTDSREGIRAGVPHNKNMIELLAELAADSLVYLRDIGIDDKKRLINDDLFNIIPYDGIAFGDLNDKRKTSYKQFYVSIKNKMRSEALLPAIDGYVSSKNAYWAERAQTVELFSNSQLGLLVGDENAKWVFTSLSRVGIQLANRPLHAYADDIVPIIINENNIINDITASFIEAQPIEWLHRFYKWISETDKRTELTRKKPIFLNQDGKAVSAFDANDQAVLFLPVEGDSDYATVNDVLLENESTRSFIMKLGISEPSLRDEIYTKILPQYKDGVVLNTKPHFKKFFQYYQNCSQTEVNSFLSQIREHSFVLHESESEKTQCRGKTSVLYFPFKNLKRWFQSKPKTGFVSFDEYLEIVGEDKKEELVKFLSALGVKDVPRILPRKLDERPKHELSHKLPRSTRGNEWHEYYIDGCEELIESIVDEQNKESSIFLWSQFLEFIKSGLLNDSIFLGRHKYFYRSQQSRRYESCEAKRLRTLSWLVNKDDEFVSTNELTAKELNSQYDLSCDEATELLSFLKIKNEIEVNTDGDEGDIYTYAESLGLSDEEQRQALLEYAKRKKVVESSDVKIDDVENESEDDISDDVNSSSSSVFEGIKRRAAKHRKRQDTDTNEDEWQPDNDEDEYVKPAVDYSKKKTVESSNIENDDVEDESEDDISDDVNSSNFHVFEDIKRHAAKHRKRQDADTNEGEWQPDNDEDEYVKPAVDYSKKKTAESSNIENDDVEDESEDDISDDVNSPISRVLKDIKKRTAKRSKQQDADTDEDEWQPDNDEDEYVKPTVDYSKKIEHAKQKSAKEIERISQLEALAQEAAESKPYTYKWFKVLLELESLSSNENNAYSREISISFAKVERELGTTRTLILKHPSRYIPQLMEDLANIPLELHFHNAPLKKVVIEVVSVKSYTLRAKLKTNADIEGIDLTLVKEARIEAKNPAFLIEELKKAFLQLGFEDDFNMQENLCENIEFVFGPPGTGKTRYLATDVILPIMHKPENKKILVLTPTNKAADVLVSRIMDVMSGDQSYTDWLVRFGTTNDSVIEQSGVFRDKTFDIRTLPKNVTVTTIARFPYDFFMTDDGTRLHLDALKWDFIVVDEASMIPLVNIVYPLYKKIPEKFIIAGDPFQIEPITSVDLWKNENIYTMVELGSFTEPTTIPHPYHVELLTTQYRSIPSIGEIFSNFAYGGVLDHDRYEESQVPLGIGNVIDIKSINIIKFPVSKYESIYRPKRLKGKSNYQVYSAIFTFEFVRYLSDWISKSEDKKLFKIGIIAPYRAQSDLIDKLMMSTTLPKNIDVQVGTIHGFQGDECDIIISVFNPPPSISASPDMFLNKRNIINVSISRARDYILIIMPDDDTENVKNLKLIKRVEELCKQDDYILMETSEIEKIMWGSATYIEDNSFSTSHQMVNVYGEPERRYEIRSEEEAVDVQIHDK